MPKVVLKVFKTEKSTRNVIRIDGEAYDTLMKIQRETGLTISKIASEFIKFGAENYEVKYVE